MSRSTNSTNKFKIAAQPNPNSVNVSFDLCNRNNNKMKL